jgi:cytochrome b subunit of formate dehydrogenase
MKKASPEEEIKIIRFSVLQRLLHLMVMVGFFGLALTGFSLKFSHQSWAQWVVGLLGGPGWTGYWHRFWAVITYSAVVIHLGWLIYFKAVLKGSLTGPQSAFPRAKDARDLVHHVNYFFGKERPPAFNRFTYWEKLDYWAMLGGMNTMGLTGLVLWFPVFFTGFLPGVLVNVARVLHLYEAILAVALKFVVHLATAHLRPEVYPADKSIFTGRTSLGKIRREHPGEWEEREGPSG